MPVIACPDCGRDVSTLAPVCPHCGRPSPAGTTPITTPAAPARPEETLWRGTPSAIRLLGKVALIVLTLLVVPIAFHWFASTANDPQRVITIGWMITGILILVQTIFVLAAYLNIRSTQYTITNQRVMIERGLVRKSLSEIDLRYVDDTQFSQSAFDRLLGIGNVTIISSDKTTPVYALAGVKDPRSLREMIRTNSYQISQRQIFTRAT